MNRLSMAAVLASAALFCAPVAGAHIVGFTSPSGNIGCMLSDDLLRCDIAARNWSPPPRPAACPADTDYGQGILVHPTGPATFVCAGDTALGGGPAMAYGEYQAGGGMSCNSESSGMRCSNSDGHGFILSRQAYKLF